MVMQIRPSAIRIKKGLVFRGQLACTSGVYKRRINKQPFYDTVLAMMKTAIYARVSTKDGRQDTENQLRQLRTFASTQDWSVVHEYVDRASGKRGDREQFQKMFSAASRREFDCLLFWSLDRLSREGTVKTLNHLERLNGYGVDYRSFTEQYLDSTGMFKEAVIGILAAVAKQERVRLSERTIAGLQRAKAHGRVGGRPKAEDTEPKLVAKIERLRSEGHSIRAIAVEVKKSPNTILRLLKSE
jgi:DNA invertase Pin-like site-specific DNA recombinase